MRTRWSNSIQIIGMIRYPHNTDLYYFLKNKSLVDIPLNDIANIMLKVSCINLRESHPRRLTRLMVVQESECGIVFFLCNTSIY